MLEMVQWKMYLCDHSFEVNSSNFHYLFHFFSEEFKGIKGGEVNYKIDTLYELNILFYLFI